MTVVTSLLTCAALCSGPAGPLHTAGEGPWQWPLDPAPRVVRAFEPPAQPWAPGHRGVDLAARPGQPVYAAGAGRVSYAARLAGRGVVAISHGRLRTTYLPVRPSVRPGQWLRMGDRIGTVESPSGHCGRRPCLHWGARNGLAYADPLSLLGRARTRLLPVWGVPAPYPAPPADAAASPTAPAAAPTDPAATPTDPGATPTDPAATPTDPAVTATDPAATATDPAATRTRLAATPTAPAAAPARPEFMPSLISATTMTGGAAIAIMLAAALVSMRRTPRRAPGHRTLRRSATARPPAEP